MATHSDSSDIFAPSVPISVIPAKAGIHRPTAGSISLDSCLRRNDTVPQRCRKSRLDLTVDREGRSWAASDQGVVVIE